MGPRVLYRDAAAAPTLLSLNAAPEPFQEGRALGWGQAGARVALVPLGNRDHGVLGGTGRWYYLGARGTLGQCWVLLKALGALTVSTGSTGEVVEC